MAVFFLTAPVMGGDTDFAAFYTEAATQQTLDIRYDDWSYILDRTVFEAGRSDRYHAAPPEPGIGRRTVKGNTSSTRLEGNRLNFPAFEGQNLMALRAIQRDLAAMPDAVPMAEWTRNQQLAYWLNLYNITLVAELAEHYPEQELRSLLYGDGDRGGLLDEPLVTVAGVMLSLNNIHHDILNAGWRNPLVMYGLFHGYVGSPNIRAEAYTAATVWDQLRDNAREFVNSNRGARMRGSVLHVSEIYGDNLVLFPGGPQELREHVASLADPGYAARFRAATDIRISTSDYYIADIYQGYRDDTNPNVANPGFLAAHSPAAQEFFNAKLPPLQIGRPFPPIVEQYLISVAKRNLRREGNVEIEEVSESGTHGKDGQ